MCAARAVGIGNPRPGLDEVYMLASYAHPAPILKRTYSLLNDLVEAARRVATVRWRRECAGGDEARAASMRWQWLMASDDVAVVLQWS